MIRQRCRRHASTSAAANRPAFIVSGVSAEAVVASAGLSLVNQVQTSKYPRSRWPATRLMPRFYAMSTHANAAFLVSGPVRTVMAWALVRSTSNDTGNMAPKDRNENTEGMST